MARLIHGPRAILAATAIDKVAMECGGKRSATPLSLTAVIFTFNRFWQGKNYLIKQVAPVIMDEANEIVVITVYTFYF